MHAADDRQEGVAADPDEAATARVARRSRATARSVEIEAGPALSHTIALRHQQKREGARIKRE